MSFQFRVGGRVQVYWEEDDEWYNGNVAEIDSALGYFIQYDDGDQRWELPNEIPIRLLSPQQDNLEIQFNSNMPEISCSPEHFNEQEINLNVNKFSSLSTSEMLEPPNTHDSESDQEYTPCYGNIQSPRLSYESSTEDTPEIKCNLSDTLTTFVTSIASGKDLYNGPQQTTANEKNSDTMSDDNTSVLIDLNKISTTSVVSVANQTSDTQTQNMLPQSGVLWGVLSFSSSITEGEVQLSDVNTSNNSNQIDSFSSLFVQVDFIEKSHASIATLPDCMLRCKTPLTVAALVYDTSNSVWTLSDNHTKDSQVDEAQSLIQFASNTFHCELEPTPKFPNALAWTLLNGDFVFTVFDRIVIDSGVTQKVDIMQGSLSLQLLLKDVVPKSSIVQSSVSTYHEVILQTRQQFAHSYLLNSMTLGVKFTFEPTFVTSPSQRSLNTANLLVNKKSAQSNTAFQSKRPEIKSRRHKASSDINRGIFIAKIQQQNILLSKLRNDRARPVIPLIANSNCPPPVKASSGINRRKANKQIEVENKKLNKRMLNCTNTKKCRSQSNGLIQSQANSKVDGQHCKNKGSSNKSLAYNSKSPSSNTDTDFLLAFAPVELYQQHKIADRCSERDFNQKQAQIRYEKHNKLTENIYCEEKKISNLKQSISRLKICTSRYDLKISHYSKAIKVLCQTKAQGNTHKYSSIPAYDQCNPCGNLNQLENPDEICHQQVLLSHLKNQIETTNALKIKLTSETVVLQTKKQNLEDENNRMQAKIKLAKVSIKFRKQLPGLIRGYISSSSCRDEFIRRRKQNLLEQSEEILFVHNIAKMEFQELQSVLIGMSKVNNAADSQASSLVQSPLVHLKNNEYPPTIELLAEKRNSKNILPDDKASSWQSKYESIMDVRRSAKLSEHLHQLQQILFSFRS